MQVFWLRHATRNYTVGDVPLNEEGKIQAQELTQNSLFSQLTHILSSPKARAIMTVEPLAQKYDLDIIQIDELDQMKIDETGEEFFKRVKAFLQELEKGNFGKNTLICTHSDWLNAAAQVIPSDALNLKNKMFQCAEALAFDIKDGLWRIQD